jgi:hypothetical protein
VMVAWGDCGLLTLRGRFRCNPDGSFSGIVGASLSLRVWMRSSRIRSARRPGPVGTPPPRTDTRNRRSALLLGDAAFLYSP